MSDNNNKFLVIISSLGKGFGRSLAVAFSRALLSKLHFILIGRNEEEVNETAEIVGAIRPDTITSEIMVVDLADSAAVTTLAENLFTSRTFKEYEHVTFINNAQTIQPIGSIGTTMNAAQITTAIQLNITTPMFLTSECVRAFRDPSRCPARAAVVNISHLWATEPAATFGVYSASKAAMEMYYEVLSKEALDIMSPPGPFVKVLNYSPGPIDTSLQEEIRESPNSDPNWQMSCCQMKKEGTLIDPNASARKCALLVIQELYDTGDHIDYYDLIEGVDYARKVVRTCCSNPNCQCGVNCRCSAANGPQCGGCQSFMLQNR